MCRQKYMYLKLFDKRVAQGLKKRKCWPIEIHFFHEIPAFISLLLGKTNELIKYV